MKIAKEQSEILLMEYACGTLDEARALLVASYITLCPQARAYVRHYEALGGTLMEKHCQPVAMEKGSLQNVLGRLDSPGPAEAPADAERGFCADKVMPAPLSRYMVKCEGRAQWKKLNHRISFYRLPCEDGRYSAVMLKIAPHTKGPDHRHTGMEMTLVLSGGYRDDRGAYSAGDLVVCEEDTRHTPVAGSEGCTCIVVSERPLHFTSGLYRLLNLFTH